MCPTHLSDKVDDNPTKISLIKLLRETERKRQINHNVYFVFFLHTDGIIAMSQCVLI